MKICHNRRGKWEGSSVSILHLLMDHIESGTCKDNVLRAEATPELEVSR